MIVYGKNIINISICEFKRFSIFHPFIPHEVLQKFCLVGNKIHNSVKKITKLEVHKTCDKIGITPPENGNRNGPDLVQAFQKKWWVESRFYSAYSAKYIRRPKLSRQTKT